MEQLPANDHIWNRKLIHMLWWILLIYEAASMSSFFFDRYDQSTNWFFKFLHFQIVPTSMQLSLMGAGYLANYFLKRYSDFIMIIWTMTMVSIFILCIPEMIHSYELISIGIILASFYFQKKSIIFEEVLDLCEQFMQMIRITEIPEMPGHPLTMSIGLAAYNRNTMKKAWFQQVDECLYTAKRNGKNRIHVHLVE